MSDNSTCFVISDIFQNDAIGLCAGINLNKILNSIVLHRTFKILLVDSWLQEHRVALGLGPVGQLTSAA